MANDRDILAQLIKNWAQDHSPNFIIASDEPGDEGVGHTGSYLAGVVQAENIGLDLVGLLDRLELYVDRIRGKRGLDGMFCRKCKSFYKYAEGNQPDGSLLCYSCRNNPYT